MKGSHRTLTLGEAAHIQSPSELKYLVDVNGTAVQFAASVLKKWLRAHFIAMAKMVVYVQ